MDAARGAYMDWIWEIPIGPDTLSVGYVTTGETMKKRRDQGLTVEDILRLQLERFPRLASPLQKGAGKPELDDCGRGSLDGRSHHLQWRNRGPEACRGSVGSDRGAERKIRAAVQGQSFL